MSQGIFLWVGILIFTTTGFSQYLRVDPTFVVNLNDTVSDLAIQPDGRIIVGGRFTNVNGVLRQRVARLFSDGSLDETFAIAPGLITNLVSRVQFAASSVYAQIHPEYGRTYRFDLSGSVSAFYPLDINFVVDSKDRLVWGQITESPQWPRRLGRLNEDGSRDSTFSPIVAQCCSDMGVNALAIQNDSGQEKVLIGGNFVEVNTNRCLGLARLNDDGSVDTTFQGGTRSPVVDLKLWKNGMFYAATRHSISRHFADGSQDLTYTNWDLMVFQRIFPESDGRVLALLDWIYDSLWMVRRYNNDGSVDTNFSINLDQGVFAVAIQSDGGILLGGSFTNVNCIRRPFLVRLIESTTPDSLPCIPKPEPELTMTRLRWARMVCCWPTNYPEYTLQATRRLRPNHREKEKWFTVTNAPVMNESNTCVTNRILRWGRHYRLVKQ